VGYTHGFSEGVGVEEALEGVGVEVEEVLEGVGVEVEETTGMGVAVGVEIGDSVTVNIAVAELLKSSVAVTLYVSGSTNGTVNPVFITPELSADAIAISDPPKLMLTS